MIKLYNFDELRPEEILNRDIARRKTWRMWWTASLPRSAPGAMRR